MILKYFSCNIYNEVNFREGRKPEHVPAYKTKGAIAFFVIMCTNAQNTQCYFTLLF